MSAVFAFRAMKKRAEAAEREVARLTEALVAAERQLEAFGKSTIRLLTRAESAESDRDAARALLVEGVDGHGGNPHWINKVGAHLSGQPAAPACACGHPEDSGKHGASMCEIEEDDQREPAPTPHEAHSCDWFGRFTCRICGKHRDSVAADTKREAVWAVVNTKHNGVMLSVDDLREQLAAQGLHVVTAADKAVLDAMADSARPKLCALIELWPGSALADACRAELARREQNV